MLSASAFSTTLTALFLSHQSCLHNVPPCPRTHSVTRADTPPLSCAPVPGASARVSHRPRLDPLHSNAADTQSCHPSACVTLCLPQHERLPGLRARWRCVWRACLGCTFRFHGMQAPARAPRRAARPPLPDADGATSRAAGMRPWALNEQASTCASTPRRPFFVHAPAVRTTIQSSLKHVPPSTSARSYHRQTS
jgi:hypothetical protein